MAVLHEELSTPYLGEPGGAAWLAACLGSGLGALLLSLEYLAVLVLLHSLLKRKAVVVLMTALVGIVITSAGAPSIPIAILLGATSTLGLIILLRYGLLPTVIFFQVAAILEAFPPGLPRGGFGYGATAVALIMLALVLVTYPIGTKASVPQVR